MRCARIITGLVRFHSYSQVAGATAPGGSAPPSKPKQPSMVSAGTVLKGVNVRKKGEDPVALEDSEYPQWLWDVLDPEAQKAKLAANPALAAKKAQRAANRARIKAQNFQAKMRK